MKKLSVVVVTIFYFIMVSCNNTQYTTKENCYTCRHIVFENAEYSEDEFGEMKRLRDSIYEERVKNLPSTALPKPISGYYRIKEIWKECDVIVLFLEDPETSKKISGDWCTQVISLADKPKYKGKALKVGKVYYFELVPLFPFNKAPSRGLEFRSQTQFICDQLLIDNHWLRILHYSGINVYTSVNLNGDKYISTENKKIRK